MYQNFFTPSYMQMIPVSCLMEKVILVLFIAFLNSELDNLSIWLCANKLSLNVQKTYFMVFTEQK